MRTEIPPPNEIPAITAGHMPRAIARALHACETGKRVLLERVRVDGDAALVTCPGAGASGRSFRNWEYTTFRTGQIASIEGYYGPDNNNAGALLKRPIPN